jgi:anhydro-N-acetylmuramic acid kinase
MTGTSIDSIDAAVVRISGRGLDMRAEFLRGASSPLGDLAARLRRLAEQHPMAAGEIAALSRDFSLAHIPVLREAIGQERIDLACIHGQTVFHQPPVSWQMLTPACIAHELKIPIVSDLRAADLAAGGQGAPVTPIADLILYGAMAPDGQTIVNLGGFCNITVLPARTEITPSPQPELASPIEAKDVCACNQLLDAIARARLDLPYDQDGRRGLAGTPQKPVTDDLHSLLAAQARSGRSLGTGDELARCLDRHGNARPEDLLSSACDAIAATIAPRIRGRAILAGGGVRNLCLLRSLRTALPDYTTSDALGLPSEYREAACFAILGALCQDRIPITLPAITRLRGPAPIAGSWVLP